MEYLAAVGQVFRHFFCFNPIDPQDLFPKQHQARLNDPWGTSYTDFYLEGAGKTFLLMTPQWGPYLDTKSRVTQTRVLTYFPSNPSCTYHSFDMFLGFPDLILTSPVLLTSSSQWHCELSKGTPEHTSPAFWGTFVGNWVHLQSSSQLLWGTHDCPSSYKVIHLVIHLVIKLWNWLYLTYCPDD